LAAFLGLLAEPDCIVFFGHGDADNAQKSKQATAKIKIGH
jgi:hypothetical protein